MKKIMDPRNLIIPPKNKYYIQGQIDMYNRLHDAVETTAKKLEKIKILDEETIALGAGVALIKELRKIRKGLETA